MKRLSKTIAFLTAFLGIKEIPIEGGKSNFSEEQKEKLKGKLGEKALTDAIAAIDKEATAILKEQENSSELSEIRKELKAALAETNASEEEVIDQVKKDSKNKAKSGDGEISLTEEVRNLVAQIIESNKNQDQLIQKLINDPEVDSPVAQGQINPNGKVKHSNTHLMASGKEYDAFEGRPWNKRAAEGNAIKKTDWASSSGVEIQKLNGDLDLYFRENPEAIRSLHRDNFGLPSFWPKRTKVDDQVTDATIVTAEITQARKLNWLPKNKQAIKPETGKIFPVQIDIEYVGKMLQDLEASWLNKWVGGGSSPYKESFVRFLVSELDKKARAEDRMSTIKGVYVPTPDNATVAGRAINRQDGLLIQLFRAFYVKKQFKAANIGAPTKQNIVDYVPKFIESNLPEEVRNESDLVLYMSPSWLRTRKTRYRQIHGIENDFKAGDVMTIENYPNIRIETLVDLEGTDFMFITFANNIEILENLPEEKSLYRFEKLLRKIYVLGDYKLGVRMVHIGNKVKDGDPDEFKVQTVWTNAQPMFNKNFYAPLHDDKTGEIEAVYSNLVITDEWGTDITDITGTYPGQVVKIRGNQSATKAVKNNDKFNLTADFSLATGGTLTLYVQQDGTLKELSRTTSPEINTPEDVNFEISVVDATDGSDQTFTGDEATSLEEIVNGTEGQELTITAAENAAAFTINNISGNVNVSAVALLDSAGDTISFVYVDGIWMETSRTIAA